MNAGSLDGSKDLGVVCKFVVVSDEELDVSKGSVESGVDRVLFGATSSFLRIRSPYVPVEGAVTLAERMEQAVAATPTPIEDMRGYSDDVAADETTELFCIGWDMAVVNRGICALLPEPASEAFHHLVVVSNIQQVGTAFVG